jgi:hypothetical protein
VLVRRLLIALAVLLVLTALAGGLAAPPGPVAPGSPEAPPAEPVASTQPVEKTLDAAVTGQQVRARVGQSVVIQVRSDHVETISLDQYGNQSADAATPARFELLADAPGRYAISLLEEGRRIGTLDVQP